MNIVPRWAAKRGIRPWGVSTTRDSESLRLKRTCRSSATLAAVFSVLDTDRRTRSASLVENERMRAVMRGNSERSIDAVAGEKWCRNGCESKEDETLPCCAESSACPSSASVLRLVHNNLLIVLLRRIVAVSAVGGGEQRQSVPWKGQQPVISLRVCRCYCPLGPNSLQFSLHGKAYPIYEAPVICAPSW